MASNPTNPTGGFSHLHYGGSMRPNGSLSPKPQKGSIFRKQKRLETMVRLEAAGIPEAATASMLAISLNRLRHIKRGTDYLNARIRITHGIILDNDAQLGAIKEQRKEMLTQMLPAALQVLANELQRPANTIAERRHQVSLMQDLLDREGTFAKVSRTEIKPVEAFDFERADEASRSIIGAIRAVAPAPPIYKDTAHSAAGAKPSEAVDSTGIELVHTHTVEAIAANEAFSNSRTLSAVEQQAALASLEAASDALDALPEDATVN